MSDDFSAASSAISSQETSRRRLLAFLGAGGAAVLASLFSRNEAQAGHDGTNVMHFGEGNSAPAGRKTGAAANVNAFAFDFDNFNTGSTAGGLHGRSLGSLPAIQGVGHDPSFAGVFGVSGDAAGSIGKGSRAGVHGVSGSGPGVMGQSDTGVGGAFSSVSGKGLQVDGVASVFASVPAEEGVALFVENRDPGGPGIGAGGGLEAVSHGGAGVEGSSFPNEFVNEFGEQQLGVGVAGVSMSATGGFGEGPGTGVQGSAGTGTGVKGFSGGSGTGVEGESLSGVGVRAMSDTGIALLAANGGPDIGVALAVNGRSHFDTAGAGVIRAGARSAFVAAPAVTADSHVSVTLTRDPGPDNAVQWVEPAPNAGGFTVHLLRRVRRDTSLTFLIVEHTVV